MDIKFFIVQYHALIQVENQNKSGASHTVLEGKQLYDERVGA